MLFWFGWLFGGARLIGHLENWTTLQSIYFAVISGSTVGFGDFAPVSQEGKLLTVLYLPILIALTASVFSTLFSGVLGIHVLFFHLERRNSKGCSGYTF